jgi:hypothetical protein
MRGKFRETSADSLIIVFFTYTVELGYNVIKGT